MLKFTLLLALFPLLLQAQSKKTTHWNKGILINFHKDTLHGEIAFRDFEDRLLFKNTICLKSFAVNQLQSFQYFDEQLQLQRYFANYSVNSLLKDKGENGKLLFEEMIVGTVSYLRRKEKFLRIGTTEHFILKDKHYLWHQGKLIKVKRFNKQFKEFANLYALDTEQIYQKRKYKPYQALEQMRLIYTLNREITLQRRLISELSE